MFFYASKILDFLITPIVWISLLLLFALFAKDKSRKRQSLILATLLLLLFSNSFILDEAMRKWEIPARSQESLGTYDVGIVLGGVMFYDSELERLQFHRSVDRVLQAIDLYKKGYIKKILFTGGSGSITYQDLKEAPLIKAYLLLLGIPEKDIIIESASDNTHENAQFTKEILNNRFKEQSYLLISSAFHMRRAVACFENEGIKVDVYSTDRYSGERKFMWDHAFIPNAETLQHWDTLIHEIVGYWVYRMAGYA